MKLWICTLCGQVVFNKEDHRQFGLMEFDTKDFEEKTI